MLSRSCYLMNNLKTTIENLYSTFAPYTTMGIHHCTCGCINEEDVKKLHSKPLRELQSEDLVSYHGSALYTWGDLEHYKHFLPRVLELYAANRTHYIDLFEIAGKLEYAQWTHWPANEVEAIKDFILADWRDWVNSSKAEIRTADLENYSRFFGLDQLLSLWRIHQSATALRNFVLFFYDHGNGILAHNFKLNGKDHAPAFKKLIYDPALAARLQDAFFRYEGTNKTYAEKVSVVLQMIEQQIKSEQLSS